MSGRIVVAGSIAQKAGRGGHAWVLLQYLLGFRRLGRDVLFVDRLEPSMHGDARGRPSPSVRAMKLRFLEETFRRAGLDGCFTVLDESGESIAGLERPALLDRVEESDLLLNVMGFLTDEEILSAASRSAFLDIDPGFPQMWRALGLADVLAGHDAFVTVGRNVGQDGCGIPTCGLDWIATSPPVVLEHWPCRPGDGGGRFNTVASWRGAYAPIDFGGKRYGLRVHEFRKFAALPLRSGRSFEVALDIHPDEVEDLTLLADNGWRVADPREEAGDPWTYRSYIQGSGAEFAVAKNIYVETRSGWFSDRSACYLASGKPVVVQDTDLAEHYPIGKGLLTFTTPEEALEAVQRVCADYETHARAARTVAERCFDSDEVLSRLLAALGVD